MVWFQVIYWLATVWSPYYYYYYYARAQGLSTVSLRIFLQLGKLILTKPLLMWGRKKCWFFQNRAYTEKTARTLKGCISLNYNLHWKVILLGQNSLTRVLLFSLFYEVGVPNTGSDMVREWIIQPGLIFSGIRATIQEKACVRPLSFNKLIVMPVISQ